MPSSCPVCQKPFGWFDRISRASMCRDCHKVRGTIPPVILPKEPEESLADDEVIQITCREPFSEQVRFSSEYSKEVHRKVWPWGIQHVLGFFPLLLPVAILSAFFSFSEKVLLVGLALWFANYLFGLLYLQADHVFRAKYLAKLLGDEWLCEIAKDTVSVKHPGHHSVFVNRHLTRIEDSDQAVVLYYGDFGRLRIPFPSSATEPERLALARKIGRRLKPALPQ